MPGLIDKSRRFIAGLLDPRTGSPGRTLRLRRAAKIQGKYDSAQTTETNSRHWINADSLSANAANSPAIRKETRNRARYECIENNTIGNHIVRTLASDLVGRGPKLQTATQSIAFNREVGRAFNSWARKIHLSMKLRTMRQSKAVDGEAFAQFITNRRLRGVQLDLRLIECDQISTPMTMLFSENKAVDGIVFDDDGNPQTYHRLKAHPGSTMLGVSPNAFDEIPAEEIIHAFRPNRPGQNRGISEIQAALPLFAHLRRYTLSVIDSSETAANLSAVMETDSSAMDEDGSNWDPEVEAFDMVDIDRDMMTTLPYGWKMRQFKPEQPTTNYDMFVRSIVNQIACVVDMPLNIALCNSSGYNYSSGRLDHQTYFKSLQVERCYWEIEVLDRIFEKWFDEAVLIPGLIPEGLGAVDEIPHTWAWDGREHIDPAKEATAQATKLSSGTTQRAREYAAHNLDVDEEDARAAETYGVSVKDYRRAVFANLYSAGVSSEPPSEPPSDDEDNKDDENGNPKEEEATARAAA